MTLREAIDGLGRDTVDISADAARGRPDGDREPRRITADVDDATPFEVVRAWRTFEEAGAVEVHGRVSAGGEGAHVRGVIDADAATAEAVRYDAGDHARRTYMDRTHALKPTNITFTRKPGGEAGPWRADVWRLVDDLKRSSDRYGPAAGWSP